MSEVFNPKLSKNENIENNFSFAKWVKFIIWLALINRQIKELYSR